MNNNVNGYISYFRSLAVSHKDLRHDPASETGDAAIGSMRFTKISVEEVITGLRSKISFPALTLELYETETKSEMVYDVKQDLRGAFMVMDHPQDRSFPAEQVCYERSEKIVYELLQQIWQHHYGPLTDRCTTPFKDFSFDKIQITPVGPVFNGEFGYRVEFDFAFFDNVNFARAPAPGTFL